MCHGLAVNQLLELAAYFDASAQHAEEDRKVRALVLTRATQRLHAF